jgi:hypothetical protein
MSFQSTTYNGNFGIRNPVNVVTPNRAPAATSLKVIKQDLGSTGTAIPVTTLLNSTIVVSPSAPGQVYTLPSASAILNQFGRNTDTGVAKLAVGDTLVFDIVNRGTTGAFISASGALGGDNTQINSLPGATSLNWTGTTPLGRTTTVRLEFLQVGSGVAGATGQYTIYA